MSINEGFLIKTSTSTSASSSSSKTPYQVAVENGYEGTEAEFNNALTKIDQVIYYEEKGNPEGVASLGDDGKVPYFQLPDFVKTEDKGKIGGVASLGDDGKVPTSQLPDSIGGGGVGKTFVGTVKVEDLSDSEGDGSKEYDKTVTKSDHAEIFNDYRDLVYDENRHNTTRSYIYPWLSQGNAAAGEYSVVFGEGCMNQGDHSFVGGNYNTNSCGTTPDTTFMWGYKCKNQGSNSAIFGSGNGVIAKTSAFSQYNIVFGANNFVDSDSEDMECSHNLIFGSSSTSRGSGNLIGGKNLNISEGTCDILFGASNTAESETLDNAHDYGTYNVAIGTDNKVAGYHNFLFGTANGVKITNTSLTKGEITENAIFGRSNYLYDAVVTGATNNRSLKASLVYGVNNSIFDADYSLIGGIGNYCINAMHGAIIGSNNQLNGLYSFIIGNQCVCGSPDEIAYYSIAEGHGTKVLGGYYSRAQGWGTSTKNYASCAMGRYNTEIPRMSSTDSTNGTALALGNGTGSSSRSNAFRVNFNGAVYGLSNFNSSGADYAEYFEWLDNNPNNQDRVGYFVAMVDDKIVFANPGDFILGVVSGQPCIIGNSDEDWLGRWERDEFDRFIKEYYIEHRTEIEVPENEEEKLELLKDPAIIPADGKYYKITQEIVDYETSSWHYKENPDYDSTQSYIERKDRKEWSAVGMMGVLAVRDDGSCSVNGYCKVDNGGTATSANEYIPGQTWRVIKRVSESVIKIVFK